MFPSQIEQENDEFGGAFGVAPVVTGRPSPVHKSTAPSITPLTPVDTSVSGATQTTFPVRNFVIPQQAPDTNPSTQPAITGGIGGSATGTVAGSVNTGTPATSGPDTSGGTPSGGAPDTGLINSLMGLVSNMYAGAGVSGGDSGFGGEVLGPIASAPPATSRSQLIGFLVIGAIGIGVVYWLKHRKGAS